MGGDRCGAQGYVVSGKDGRVLSEHEIRRICVRTSNRFRILENMGEDDDDDTTSDERIFMGDSIIRKIDGRGRRRRQCVCLEPEWNVSGSEWVR